VAVPVFLAAAVASATEWSVELETGGLWAGYCDVRIPGTTGTDISFTDDLDAEAAMYLRAKFEMLVAEKHQFSVELAPLSVNSSGSLDSDVDFAGVTFPAGSDVTALFKFNTYRMLYRYRFRDGDSVRAALGATLLVRDAMVRMESGALQDKDTDLGLVPLLGVEYARRMGDRWWLVFDLNAAAAPQGRAEDLLIGASYEHSDLLALNLGYRLIEGGADIDQVYTFAALHHAAVGLTLRF
jgi:hypothetical protein